MRRTRSAEDTWSSSVHSTDERAAAEIAALAPRPKAREESLGDSERGAYSSGNSRDASGTAHLRPLLLKKGAKNTRTRSFGELNSR